MAVISPSFIWRPAHIFYSKSNRLHIVCKNIIALVDAMTTIIHTLRPISYITNANQVYFLCASIPQTKVNRVYSINLATHSSAIMLGAKNN